MGNRSMRSRRMDEREIVMKLSAPTSGRRSFHLIRGKGLQVIFFEVASFFHFGFARHQNPHLALGHRLGIGLNEPYLAGKAVHFVRGIDWTARRCDRVNAADNEGEQKRKRGSA